MRVPALSAYRCRIRLMLSSTSAWRLMSISGRQICTDRVKLQPRTRKIKQLGQPGPFNLFVWSSFPQVGDEEGRAEQAGIKRSFKNYRMRFPMFVIYILSCIPQFTVMFVVLGLMTPQAEGAEAAEAQWNNGINLNVHAMAIQLQVKLCL